eukprot:1107-Heterococcus_DN1.PRE.7
MQAVSQDDKMYVDEGFVLALACHHWLYTVTTGAFIATAAACSVRCTQVCIYSASTSIHRTLFSVLSLDGILMLCDTALIATLVRVCVCVSIGLLTSVLCIDATA